MIRHFIMQANMQHQQKTINTQLLVLNVKLPVLAGFARRWTKWLSMVKTGLAKIVFAGKNRF